MRHISKRQTEEKVKNKKSIFDENITKGIFLSKKSQRKYKEFNLYSWLFLTGGILLFGIGFYIFFFLEPAFAVNLKTQQPVVANGTILLILGVGFFAGGLYRNLNRKNVFKRMIDNEIEIKEKGNQERQKKFGL